MRLIDADALMNYCNNLKDKTIDANDIARFPTAIGWISVNDGLPKKSGNVLVCVKLDYADGARYVQMCHYSAYKKQFGCFDTLESNDFPKFGVVTYWMPLPEPPKEATPDD